MRGGARTFARPTLLTLLAWWFSGTGGLFCDSPFSGSDDQKVSAGQDQVGGKRGETDAGSRAIAVDVEIEVPRVCLIDDLGQTVVGKSGVIA